MHFVKYISIGLKSIQILARDRVVSTPYPKQKIVYNECISIYKKLDSSHLLSLSRLAVEHRRARRSIGLLSIVQVVQNALVVGTVCTWQADGARGLARASTLDINLSTLHVKLRTLRAGSAMKSNELSTE